MSDSNVVPVPDAKPFLSNVQYDHLKFLAQIVLPALGTLYAALAALWELPKPEAIVGTIMALDAFLGVLLGLSSRQYAAATPIVYDGRMVVNASDTSMIYELEVMTPPEQLGDKDTLLLKVVKK